MAEAETQIEPGTPSSGATEGLYLGDAIHFFLSAKRAGGRSERTIDDYRKKLELFQRWAAVRLGGEGAVDAPYMSIGADATGRLLRPRARPSRELFTGPVVEIWLSRISLSLSPRSSNALTPATPR